MTKNLSATPVNVSDIYAELTNEERVTLITMVEQQMSEERSQFIQTAVNLVNRNVRLWVFWTFKLLSTSYSDRVVSTFWAYFWTRRLVKVGGGNNAQQRSTRFKYLEIVYGHHLNEQKGRVRQSRNTDARSSND